jgi:hypothetical protein
VREKKKEGKHQLSVGMVASVLLFQAGEIFPLGITLMLSIKIYTHPLHMYVRAFA